MTQDSSEKSVSDIQVPGFEGLLGRTAWISGATSGIGLATARMMAQMGASVIVADVHAEACDDVAKQIIKAGGRAIGSACDVSDEEQVRLSLAQGVEHFDSLHVLVNNAGVVDVRPLHETTSQQWQQVMAVNVNAIFYSLKHGFTHLRKNQRSWIVNVGSVSSFVGQSQTPAYTSSKHAVLGLTRSIALDYAEYGIRCNCVCPGITDTPMLRHHLAATGNAEKTLQDRLQRVCMGVPLTPEDIARAIVYLASDVSAGVTGTSLVVDGGYLAAAEWCHPGSTRFMEPLGNQESGS